jgi:hypothetical protein
MLQLLIFIEVKHKTSLARPKNNRLQQMYNQVILLKYFCVNLLPKYGASINLSFGELHWVV